MCRVHQAGILCSIVSWHHLPETLLRLIPGFLWKDACATRCGHPAFLQNFSGRGVRFNLTFLLVGSPAQSRLPLIAHVLAGRRVASY